jgi:hypothetical protein
MEELVANLHLHTRYSDGSGTYAEVAQAGLRAGVDVLLISDHNVWVQGVERYYRAGERRLLLLVGEEIHDQDRQPQKNHLLVFGAGRELATLADDPQAVIDAARTAGGLTFLAHPIDPELRAFGEADISWVDWQVRRYTGLELWNAFSELKTVVRSKLHGLFYAYFPAFIARGPLPATLRLWDDLLAQGQRVVAIGGSDAHARQMTLGPFRRVIFPYGFHFAAVNTHLLLPQPLSGVLETDRRIVLTALAEGHCFVGYDLAAPTRGFRFLAHGKGGEAMMGDVITLDGGVTLQVKLPAPADELRLLKDGQVIRRLKGEALVQVVTQAGVYRVEAYRRFLGRRRGWIFSNPIYVREAPIRDWRGE